MILRLANRQIGEVLRAFGARAYFARDIARGVRDLTTWLPETIRQMQRMGVESVPLTVIVAAFLGGVTAFQTRYQLFPGVQLSVVGLIARQSIVLELGPLLTALVLTGRVGARMTAEIGTMRVTEQIDALETLSFDPVAYLALPRLLAGLVMLPALVMLANATAIFSAWATLVLATDVRTDDFLSGLRLAFTSFQVVYSMIKAFCFGAAIAFVCAYQGYVTEAGAEGVGRSTAQAVVIASVAILVLDAIVAAVFAPFIQA
ncbi:MAG: MlaE family ABC transporter permease [Gemmatimonas sp.]|jgi:phospholipid/cholesterol/gamma-HCH transport system permease protein|uniref:MlaE family ABC transporter permease n=1 Tax=Gemmatimonas sp. TaxID=1962908 RepID=UPI00391F42F6|nr:ABC transporter permease [Gemmatimonadota bacterium]